ncbi:MAG: malto-oligosyltrehalose synthase [Candidatus Nanopelagicales bacterium]
MGQRNLPGPGRRLPLSTYRLQLGPDLSFDEVAARLDYYEALGVTDLYLSPILTAAPGSTHGYDVIDHTRISEVMGGRAAFERLAEQAHSRGLGILVDMVPNHMAVPTPAYLNRALWSVLAQGTDSPYASWFDVDWGSSSEARVLMPILGARIGDVLGAGELAVEEMIIPELGDEPQWVLRYYEHVLPVRPGTESLALADLVERQFYRLAYWQVADEELNYRRFFDVGTLAAVRVEVDEVFDATHSLLLELFDAGHIDGFRIDHPDGLADPRRYFTRLSEATDGAWVVAEKILEPEEEVPSDWAVAGTTGYDAMWRIQALFIDPDGGRPLGKLMAKLAGDVRGDLEDLIEAAKEQVVAGPLYAEVDRLTSLMADICDADVRLRDHTSRALRESLMALLVAFDRYRAYIVPGEAPGKTSREVMAAAAERARTALDGERHATLDVVVDLLLGREVGSSGRVTEPERAELIVRFQQVCGAVMAKGVEDTAFYRWTHLVSLCEVGGAPQRFGVAPDELHTWARNAVTAMPATMTAGSTHDAKRGEDVRARLSALAEYPDDWVELVTTLRDCTEDVRPTGLDGRTENLLWQILAGTWTTQGPISAERLVVYLEKASREAKTWTSWQAPDVAAEEALAGYATHLVRDPEVAEHMSGWVKRTATSVRATVLGTKLVQLTLPGVADVYQGTESLGVALVDPDNRGPVDATALAARLARLDEGASPSGLSEEKLALTAAALRLRRAHPGAFVGPDAGYKPLPTSTGHAVAFARTQGDRARVVTVVTRLSSTLHAHGGWDDHTVVLPEGRWRNLLSSAGAAAEPIPGGPVELAVLLRNRPVALLVAEEDPDAVEDPADPEATGATDRP